MIIPVVVTVGQLTGGYESCSGHVGDKIEQVSADKNQDKIRPGRKDSCRLSMNAANIYLLCKYCDGITTQEGMIQLLGIYSIICSFLLDLQHDVNTAS
jgi:hypothetical protein